MDDNKYWSIIWSLAAGVAVVAVLTAGGCSAYTSSLVADAIAHGADPVAAQCGIVGIPSSNGAVCVMRK